MREVVVERALDGGREVDLGFPAEVFPRVGDGGHAFLDVLVILAEVLARRHDHDPGLLGMRAVGGILPERGDDEPGELGHADVVFRVADVEDAA